MSAVINFMVSKLFSYSFFCLPMHNTYIIIVVIDLSRFQICRKVLN